MIASLEMQHCTGKPFDKPVPCNDDAKDQGGGMAPQDLREAFSAREMGGFASEMALRYPSPEKRIDDKERAVVNRHDKIRLNHSIQ